MRTFSITDKARLWVPVICVAVTAGGVSAAVAGTNGPADDYVSDVAYVTAATGFDAVDSKSVDADCPANMNVLGGGADIDDNPAQGGNETENVALRSSQPFPNDAGSASATVGTGWTAIASETDQVTDEWNLDAWAVCADVNSPGGGGGPVVVAD